jgi:hypothetical protein
VTAELVLLSPAAQLAANQNTSNNCQIGQSMVKHTKMQLTVVDSQ